MLFSRVICPGLLPVLFSRVSLTAAAPAQRDPAPDPCAEIAGLSFVDPADVIACQKSFPFDEDLRDNVLSVVSRVFDFYTFEDYYYNSPEPFQESTKDIRGEIARIRSTEYATDYDFNMDLWDFTIQLNDGHTRWYPFCYTAFQNILPAPIVLLDTGVFIAPDSDVLFDGFGKDFADYFTAKGFDWKRLAGAEVLEIDGLPVLEYIDQVARTASGDFLDHNIRVNRVISSYQLYNGSFFQRLGDLASSSVVRQTCLKFSLIPVDSPSGTPECIDVPFVSAPYGQPFVDEDSYWDNNCVATDSTNGVDRKTASGTSESPVRGGLQNLVGEIEPDLPLPFLPTLQLSDGSAGLMQTFVLPGNKTGVMFIGSFDVGSNALNNQFPSDVKAAVDEFKSSGVTNLVIDVTNNGGGLICLGLLLYRILTSKVDFPGFQTTSRANTLAQKILKADIAQGLDDAVTQYTADNYLSLNGVQMSPNFNYNDPPLPFVINGLQDPTSQRVLTFCPVGPHGPIPDPPPFDLNNIVIVGNGACASTCAQFATLMFELHDTKIATFGGHPEQPIEYKGMAGEQVLPWADLNSEIKTAGLTADPLAPPDLLVDALMPVNWRTAYSFNDDNVPIAYFSEPSQYRFPYTTDTYNNPQKLWTFVESQFFPRFP